MENFVNGRGERLPLTSQEALSVIKGLVSVSDPDEKDKIGEGLSAKLNVPGLIGALHELLGSYDELTEIAGMSHPRAVRRWESGIRSPQSSAVGEQFRLTLKLCAIIYDGQVSHIKDWFNGANPALRNKSPLELLTQRDLRGVSKFPEQLLSAAKDFQRAPVA